MRIPVIAALFAVLLASACRENPKPSDASGQAAFDTLANRTAAEATVRGFFDWYDQFSNHPDFWTKKFDFIDTSGQHLQLVPAKLDVFLAEFVKSGFCGEAFVKNEKLLYQACNMAWQDEPKDEVPSCLDYDRYFCTQEDLREFYKKAAIAVHFDSPEDATAVVSLDFGDAGKTKRSVKLKKENGKWLMSNVDCALPSE